MMGTDACYERGKRVAQSSEGVRRFSDMEVVYLSGYNINGRRLRPGAREMGRALGGGFRYQVQKRKSLSVYGERIHPV